GQPVPAIRQDADLVDADAAGLEAALLDRTHQSVDRIAVVLGLHHLGDPAVAGIELGALVPVEREEAVTPDVGDPDIRVVGNQVDGAGAGDDAGLAAALPRGQHIDLRPAADPLGHRPVAAGIGDVLGGGRHDRIQPVPLHLVEQTRRIHQHCRFRSWMQFIDAGYPAAVCEVAAIGAPRRREMRAAAAFTTSLSGAMSAASIWLRWRAPLIAAMAAPLASRTTAPIATTPSIFSPSHRA